MKTKNLFAAIGVSVTVLSGALLLVTWIVVQDNRELRREMRSQRADLQRARSELIRSRDEASDATARLETLEKELTESKAAVAKAAAETKVGAETNAAPPEPRAYQLRAFMGNQYLGMGWVVPVARPKDPRTGQITYEPVLVFDESLRGNFTANQTSPVERESSRETTINYNYNNYPYPYWFYPFVFFNATNQPPKCDTGTPPTTVRPKPLQPPIWRANSTPAFGAKSFVIRQRPSLQPNNPVQPAPVKVQPNLNPNFGTMGPRGIGMIGTQTKVTLPLLPTGR